jgi:putative membrane protein
MKTFILSTITVALASMQFSVRAQETDPVKMANSANEKKADRKLVDEEVAEFLVKSADARMMDSREGKLAAQKGTTAAIREYGEWMVKDQAILLEKIKELAAKRNITLPTDMSEEKKEGREELAEKSGEEFDEKFIKMMAIDHKRDVKLFERVIKCEDKGVSAFARTYLPTIQAHLDKINMIKDAKK